MNDNNYQIKYTLTGRDDNLTALLNKISKTLDDINRKQSVFFDKSSTLQKSLLEKQIAYSKKTQDLNNANQKQAILQNKILEKANLDIANKKTRNKIAENKLNEMQFNKERKNTKEQAKLEELAHIREKRRIAERGKEKIYWSQQELKYLDGYQKVRMQNYIRQQKQADRQMSTRDMLQYGIGGYIGYEAGKGAIKQAIINPLKEYAGYQNLKLVSEAVYGENAQNMYNLMERRALKYGESMIDNEALFKQTGSIFPKDFKKQQAVFETMLNLSTAFSSNQQEKQLSNTQLVQVFKQLQAGMLPNSAQDLRPLLNRGIDLTKYLGEFLKLKRPATRKDFAQIAGNPDKIYEFVNFINDSQQVKQLLGKKQISLGSAIDRSKQTFSLLSARVGKSVDEAYNVSENMHKVLNSMLDSQGNLSKTITTIIDTLGPLALPATIAAFIGIAKIGSMMPGANISFISNGLLNVSKLLGPVAIMLSSLLGKGFDWSIITNEKVDTMGKVLPIAARAIEYLIDFLLIVKGGPLGMVAGGLSALVKFYKDNIASRNENSQSKGIDRHGNKGLIGNAFASLFTSENQEKKPTHNTNNIQVHFTHTVEAPNGHNVTTKIKQPVTNDTLWKDNLQQFAASY
jgi:hypothetical protein